MNQNQNITLRFKEGNSDKEYRIDLVEAPGGWLVNFAYGRAGTALKPDTKTPKPVPYAEAKKTYDKLVLEKTRKGYSPGPEGARFQGTELQHRATGRVPQLLNEVDASAVERCLRDAAFVMQEKQDGKRILIEKSQGRVTGVNRRSLSVALPEPLAHAVAALPGDFVLDGELVGETYHAFDILQTGGLPAYGERLQRLAALLAQAEGLIRLVSTARDEAAKRALFAEVKARKGEGVVFKRLDAPYTPNRPASGGPQLKHKFTQTASVIVLGAKSDKRSVRVAVLDGEERRYVGSVTIPPNKDIPPPNAIAEVRYLYAHKGGALYQPVYLGLRDDVPESACVLAQLKIKPIVDEDEEGA